MKNITKIALLLIGISLLASCSKKFYESDEMEVMRRKHQSIAVLPPKIGIAGDNKPSPSTSLSGGKVEKAYDIQKILIRKLNQESDKYSVSIMPVDKTNQKLNQSNVSYYDLYTNRSVKEVGNILYVDGILKGGIKAPGALDGKSEDDGMIEVKVSLFEANTEELLWEYKDKYKYNEYNSAEKIGDKIFSKISRKFPYK